MTNRALNLSIVPSTFIFLLKIHLQAKGLEPGGKLDDTQVLLSKIDDNDFYFVFSLCFELP